MAAPIAHIFCALSLLNNNVLEVDNVTNFIIGTSFPDIRYLGVIERNKTHVKNITWNDVINAPTSFEKGRLLHSLLDEVREEFIEKHNLYEFIPDSSFRTHILKFYEDIILYEMIKNWPEITHYFDTVLPEELRYNITNSDLKAWHHILKDYTSRQPNTSQILAFLQHHSARSIQKEKIFFKRFFLRCKGAIINRIAHFKLKSILHNLKNNNKLTASIKFFYENIDAFLMKNGPNG
jgi:hypothetical protein